MKLEYTPRKQDDEIGLIPLINIVFLLLIFFMLAGSFQQTGPFEVILPDTSSLQEAGDGRLVISLGVDGALAIDDVVVDEDALLAQLTEHVSTKPDLKVQLKADASLESESLLDALDTVKKAGVSKITLLAVVK